MATLVIGYKGLYDMAIRTGRYDYIHVGPVWSNEEVMIDRNTRWHTVVDPKTGFKRTAMTARDIDGNGYELIGWLGAFEMKDGYKGTFYMSVERIHEHAAKYSKNYKDASGKLMGVWKKETHKMERKTVLRLMLSQMCPLDSATQAALKEVQQAEENQVIDGVVRDGDVPEKPVIDDEDMAQKEEPIQLSLTSNVLHIAGGENPDPISKELWAEFEAWKSDAEKRGVKVAKVSRGATTSADLKEYIERTQESSRMKTTRADQMFSLCVRERAMWRCERCGTKHHPAYSPTTGLPGSMSLDCSHFYGRGVWALRFDPYNAFAHCRGCHSYFESHPLEFKEWVVGKHGEKQVEVMRQSQNNVNTAKLAHRLDKYGSLAKHFLSEWNRIKRC